MWKPFVRRPNWFFLRIRYGFVPLLCALLLVLNADCTLTTSDLRYSHPNTPIIPICDKPLDVPEDVKLWGFNFETRRLETDPIELRLFDSADVFFEYNSNAPSSSASEMPPEYGLTCMKRAAAFADASPTFFPPSSELFRSKDSCPAETVGRADPRFTAIPAKSRAKKPQAIVHVCARPPGIADDVVKWTSRDAKGDLLTASDEVFVEATAKAEIIFVFDPDAVPESVCWFKDPEKLSCPGQRVPKSCNQTLKANLAFMATSRPQCAELTGNPSKKGDGHTTQTSSPDGEGRPLSFLELLARNLAIAGALASGDTSGSLKDPNGSRYGIPAGKNVGGPDLLVLQAAVGTFAILGNPIKSGKELITKIARARAERKVAVILDPKVLSKDIAEELAKPPTDDQLNRALKGEIVESYGKAMAMSLHEAQVILPYSRAEIFTAMWGGKFQAHHILEKRLAEKVFNIQGKALDDIPAIILTDAQHKQITKDLKIAYDKLLRDTAGRKMERADVWRMYQEVYKDPNWLKAIEHYFNT